MEHEIRRRLPSADLLAFILGFTAMSLHYLWAPLLSLVALAVFTPSVLRELGVLKDADEYTTGIMHRAGFHAAVAVGALIFLDHFLAIFGVAPAVSPETGFKPELLRKAVIMVFLVSYLIQYWGPQRGVFWILIGTALTNLAPLAVIARPGYEMPMDLVWMTLSVACVMVAVAFTALKWPRAAGGLLLAFLVAMVINGYGILGAGGAFKVGWFYWLFQACLILGVGGVALMRFSSRSKSH